MAKHDTGIPCVVCNLRGKRINIIGEDKNITEVPTLHSLIGPGSRDYSYKEITFHCPECMIKYEGPPGYPDAENDIRTKLDEDDFSKRY